MLLTHTELASLAKYKSQNFVVASRWKIRGIIFMLLAIGASSFLRGTICRAAEGLSAASVAASPEQIRALACMEPALRGDADALFRARLKFARQLPASLYAEAALRLAAATPLLALTNSSPDLSDLTAILADKKSSAGVKDAARRILARFAYARGAVAAARALQRVRGLPTRWQVAGPFGRYGKADFYTSFAPEKSARPQTSYKTVRGKLLWQTLGAANTGTENVFPAVRPWRRIASRRGIVYAAVCVKIPTPREVRILIRTAAAWQLFSDGKKISTADRLATALPLELEVPYRLRAGEHFLLLKLLPLSADLAVSLRILNSNRNPLADLKWLPAATAKVAADSSEKTVAPNNSAQLPLGAKIKPASFYLSSLREMATNLSSSHKKIAAPLYALLARAYLAQQLGDDAVFFARRAVTLEPDNAWFQVLLGDCENGAGQLSETARRNRARLAYEAALAVRKDCVPALLGLAKLATRRKQYAVALRYCDRALQSQPRCLAVHAFRCRLALVQGWEDESRAWVAELKKLYPAALVSLRLQAMVAVQRFAVNAAAQLYERYFKLDSHEWQAGLAFAQTRAEQNKPAATVAAVEALLARHPARPDILRQCGEVYRGLAMFREALNLYRRAVKLSPAQPRLWRLIGDSLYRQDDLSGALAAYESALALQPGQHSLRLLIKQLRQDKRQGETGEVNSDAGDFWQEYLVSGQKELAAFNARTRRVHGKTVRVIDQTVLRIYPDGSTASYTHNLQKVQSSLRSVLRKVGTVPVVGETLAIRTILPDGSFREPLRLPGQNVFTMPSLGSGSAVEHIYLRNRPPRFDRRIRGTRWFFRSPVSREPYILSQFVVIVPKDYPFVCAAHNLESPAWLVRFNRREIKAKNLDVYIWTGLNLPPASHEPGAVQINERLPYVRVDTRQTWGDINKRLMKRFLGRVQSTHALRELVARLCKGCATPLEKITRLHQYVLRNIEARRTNATAGIILEQRSGRRLILLYALLKEAGFAPLMVAVRPHQDRLYAVDWDLPTTNYFTERLLAVDVPGAKRLWLDTRYRYLGTGQILEDLSRGTAFLLGRGQGTFATLPPVSPEEYTVRETRTLRVEPRANIVMGEGEWSVGGRRGQLRKEEFALLDAPTRKNHLEDFLTRSLSGVVVKKMTFPELTTVGTRFRAEYTLAIPDGVEALVGDKKSLPLFLTPLVMLPPGAERRRRRQTVFHLLKAYFGADSLRIILPARVTNIRLPKNTILRTRFGLYQLIFARQENIITIQRRFQFAPQRVSLAGWSSFAKLNRTIITAERERISFTLPK